MGTQLCGWYSCDDDGDDDGDDDAPVPMIINCLSDLWQARY